MDSLAQYIVQWSWYKFIYLRRLHMPSCLISYHKTLFVEQLVCISRRSAVSRCTWPSGARGGGVARAEEHVLKRRRTWKSSSELRRRVTSAREALSLVEQGGASMATGEGGGRSEGEPEEVPAARMRWTRTATCGSQARLRGNKMVQWFQLQEDVFYIRCLTT